MTSLYDDPVFHIGFHKTATSWLQKTYFTEHPNIALLSNSGKPWNDPFLNYLITTPDAVFDLDIARSLFSIRIDSGDFPDINDRVPMFSAERLSGHPISGGFDSIRIAERIHSAFPASRIVCVVRNPRDAIWSVYKQMVAEGFPGTLNDLLNQTPWKTTCFRLDYFDFDRLLEKYIQLYGEDRICVLRYEAMQRDMAGCLEKICSFLKIPFVFPQQARKRVYPSLPDASVGFVRRLNYLHKTELYPLPLYNLGMRYGSIRNLAVKVTLGLPILQSRKKHCIPPEIVERFKATNCRLDLLLGNELTSHSN